MFSISRSETSGREQAGVLQYCACVKESALPVASQTPIGTDGTSFSPAFDYNRPPSLCFCFVFRGSVRHEIAQRVIHLPLWKFLSKISNCGGKQCHVNPSISMSVCELAIFRQVFSGRRNEKSI